MAITASKNTEAGVVPVDWEVVPLSALTSFVSYGFTNPMPTVLSGVFMITARDINFGRILFDGARSTTEEAYHHLLTPKSRPRINDVLLTKDGTLGRLALVGQETICINQSVALLRPNERIVPSFLKILLESPVYQARMIEDAGGSTIKHIYITIVDKMAVAVPPTKTEQEAIANALSDADALIESLEKLIVKKRLIKKGAMQELLTGKRRLPGFSGEWARTTIGDLFVVSGGYTASRDQLSNDGYCYLHYGDIHTSNKNFVNVETEFQDIPKLDIPLSKVNTGSLLSDGDVVFVDASEDDEGTSKHMVIQNPNRVPFISGLHTITAKPKDNSLAKSYRRYCFQTSEVKQQFRFFAVGTKVSGISKTNIVKIFIRTPNLAEQEAIADILTDLDADIVAHEEKLAKARHIKQGMMQELLTGRIRLI